MPRFRNPVVSTADLLDGSVTTPKIANDAVTTVKIADLAVTNAKIDSLAVDKLTAGNILAQTITIGDNGSQSIIIQSDSGTTNIRSSDFVAGADGWRIQRNGSAEFNDVTVRGVLESSLFRTAASGERLQIDGETGDSFIEIYNATSLVGFIGWNATGYGASEMVFTTEINTNPIVISAHGNIDLIAGGSAGVGVNVASDAAGASPGKVLWVTNEAGTQDHMIVYSDGDWELNQGKIIAFTNTGGPLGLEFVSGEGAIYYRTSPNTISMEDLTGTELQAWDTDNGHSWLENPQTTTNSGLAAWRHDSFSGGGPYDLMPLVSSARFKKHVRRLGPREIAELAEVIDATPLSRWKERAKPLSRGRKVPQHWIHGVVAEDAAEVSYFESMLGWDEEGPLNFDPVTALAMPLVAAVKDLRRRVAELEAQLAA